MGEKAMPYIKQISIHKSPKHFLRYILRGDKNSDKKYASGISITADLDYAYDEFRDIYEAFSGKRFHDESKHTGNERVRLHHYIQSFDPKDNITPETAHDIGREWAWENFGGERQVIISTHIDKGHIHNHFAVAPYDLNGKCWYSNRSTLRTLRKSSDEICKLRGVSIIEHPARRTESKRKSFKGSFKEQIKLSINKWIINPNIYSIRDLIERLEWEGYKIRFGKYLTITPSERKYGVRSEKLGEGYAIDELCYRIIHKDKPTPFEDIRLRFTGESYRFAMTIRQMEIAAYRKPDPVYSELQKMSKLLLLQDKHKLFSHKDWERYIDDLRSRGNCDEELFQAERAYEHLNKIIYESSWQQYLDKAKEEMESKPSPAIILPVLERIKKKSRQSLAYCIAEYDDIIEKHEEQIKETYRTTYRER
jgi:hypothetical protein